MAAAPGRDTRSEPRYHRAMGRTLLVGNPTAQSGKNAARIERARAALEREGVAHDFLATLPAGGTVSAVSAALAAGGYECAVYMGGDGTFAEVAKGILASGRARTVRLGMLPTGTANDQGRSFGLSSADDQIERNVRVVAEACETALDVGRLFALDERGAPIKDDLFFDSAGWGISPRVLAARNEDRRVVADLPVVREVYRDQMVYAGALLRTFLGSLGVDEKFDAEVVADGERTLWEGLTDVIVKGTRIYGGLWVLDPKARHDDGKFEIVPFIGRRDFISKALVHLEQTGALSESLEEIGVTASKGLSAARIDVAFRRREGCPPLVGQLDGEEFPATARVRVEVLPRLLRIVVPREWTA